MVCVVRLANTACTRIIGHPRYPSVFRSVIWPNNAPKNRPSTRNHVIHLQLLGSLDIRDEDGVQLRPVLAQPKRLALLAYLALGGGQLRQRDVVLALLWPELDTARARAALRQALHHLRRLLGDGAIIGEGNSVAIDPAVVLCDACDFASDLKAGRDAAALARYGGDLLAGLHVSEASAEWESWLDGERSRLRDLALDAASRLAADARAAGDKPSLVAHLRRACQISPDDEQRARALIVALVDLGDTGAALRARDVFARRLKREFDAELSPEMAALIGTIRPVSASGPVIASPTLDAGRTLPVESDSPTATVVPSETAPPGRRWRRVLAASIGAMALIGPIVAWQWWRAPDPTVLAVGLIRDHTNAPELSAAVGELLATDLARAAGSRVISTPRMYELLAQVDSAGGERRQLGRAARAAGAHEFIEGALYRDSGGLRLELERVNLVTGRAVNVRSIRGADPFALAERATESILGTLHLARATGNLRDVVAQSPMALRFYQEGMRALSQNDRVAAKRFFAAAVGEDSSFAMATFELAMQDPQVGPLHLRALHLAAGTSDRERLIIQSTLAHLLDDPGSLAFAETLSVRYPTEPEGPLMLGRAFMQEGRFTDAIAPLRRVIVMDSASLRSSDSCRACDAYGEIVSAYISMDSLSAAERVAREYLRVQPARPGVRYPLVNVLQAQSRFDEARSVISEIENMTKTPLGEYTTRAELLVREGRLNEAEAYLLRVIEATTGDDRANARWTYTILLRTQGRYREALVVADDLRARDAAPPAPAAQKYWSGGMRAMILHDMGRFSAVIALRDSARRVPFGFTASRQARSAVSELGHIAAALAAQGDTAALAANAEQSERLGRLTGYAMHQRMFHYVRGLRLGLLGMHAEAVTELRQSIYTHVGGFVRGSYELGRELIADGRSREAASVLTAALRGPVGAGGIAVSRPQLELLLARAKELSADTVAAVAGYARAVAAWERADPSVAPLRAEGMARIRALTR